MSHDPGELRPPRREASAAFRARLARSSDPALQRLARELDLAAVSGTARADDELLVRRIWSRVATPPPARPRLGRWLAWSGVCLGALGAVLVVAHKDSHPPGATDRQPARLASAAVEQPVPAEVTEPVLSAPATLATGPRERLSARLPHGVRVELDPESRFVLEQARPPELRRGRARLEVAPRPPGAPFELVAGATRVRVVGTRFTVALAPASEGLLTVEVEEGVVEVLRAGQAVRLHAGQRWSGPHEAAAASSPAADPPATRAPREPRRAASGPRTAVSEADLEERVRRARAAGDLPALLDLLERQSRGGGLAAQNALYERGRVLRDQLGQPHDALASWRAYRNRYPAGALRAEVDLEIIETLLRLGQRGRALAEIDGFLARHPGNERAEDLSRVAQALREGRAVELR